MSDGRGLVSSEFLEEKKFLLGGESSIGQIAGTPTSSINLKESFPDVIGRSESMGRLLNKVYKAAKTDGSVLVTGESGTGKELIALSIHRLSPRASRNFISINCGAIPENLLESELFGHEKGAFTGATSRRKGLFERAHEGTVFLDEIGDMPLPLQVKLLRVLQEKKFMPIGSTKPVAADVRIVAATNINLEQAVQTGRFRLDLYYRLNVLPLFVPPLRDRGQDIELLAESFLDSMNRRHTVGNPCYFSSEALSVFRAYGWPGNVRELQNLVERLVVMSEGGLIRPQDLPRELFGSGMVTEAVSEGTIETPFEVPVTPQSEAPLQIGMLPEEGLDLTALVEKIENSYILEALDRTNNNKNKAAKLLGLNRTTLVERIKKRKLVPLNSPSREL